ncbi:hypothetical protein P0D69_30265 [Paraburkholderia sediminicola]|uniref:hypothetical protein n=1 Tax=Paraburkholderia sediminicola TaxID=458836 RepID=UPI0038B92FB2
MLNWGSGSPNWELGNDPVAPPASLTGLQSDGSAFVPKICVECYMVWKALPTGKLFGDELGETLPAWRETTELILSDQAQVPYPSLVPDLTGSAKRSTLYSALFGAGNGDGGMVKCGGRESHEAKCHLGYEATSMLVPRWRSREANETLRCAKRTLLTDINNAGDIDGQSSAVFRGCNLQ